MTVQRYAIVRGGVVENVTMWDGNIETWQPPEGTTAHAFPTGPISKGWPWNDGAPVDPTPAVEVPLADVQEARCDEVDRLYAAKCVAGVAHVGKRFEVDAKGITFITSMGAKAVGCLALPNRNWTPLQFVTADNSVHVFDTPAAFLALADAADAAVQALFGFAFLTKMTIRQLESEAAVAAYDVTTGWPEV